MSSQSILEIRDFRNLWLGQVISRVGDSFYFLGPLFVIHILYGDKAMIGYVGAAEALPFLLFGAVAGAWADRFDRKKLMVLSDLFTAVVLLLFLIAQIVYSGGLPKWIFYVFGPLISIMRLPFMPAKNALIPRLVPEDRLMKANTFSAATDQIAWFVGIALLGVVGSIAASSTATDASIRSAQILLLVVTVLNALSFLLAAYFCTRLPSVLPERTAEEVADNSLMHETIAGIKYSFSDRIIGLTMLAQMGLSLFVSPFFVVYLATNKEWFSNQLWQLTVIEAAFVVGMFTMSTYITNRQISRPGVAYSVGIFVAGASVVAMGYAQNYGLTASIHVWMIYVMFNVVCGLAIGIVDPPMMTYLQLRVPDAYRGRVMSLRFLIWMAMSPLGMALGGKLLAVIGIRGMHILMGAGFGISGVLPILNKEFRDTELTTEELAQT